MQSSGSRPLFVSALAVASLLLSRPALAASPAFTIAATNVTMPSNGNAVNSQFTLTSMGGYAGQVRVDCAYSGTAMGARVPTCGIFVNPVSMLDANKTVQGSLTLIPYGKTIGYGAASVGEKPRFGLPMCAAVILGVLLLARGMRKGTRGRHLLLALAAVTLAGMTACASAMSGTFPYTVTAVDIRTNATVSAPFTVTIP